MDKTQAVAFAERMAIALEVILAADNESSPFGSLEVGKQLAKEATQAWRMATTPSIAATMIKMPDLSTLFKGPDPEQAKVDEQSPIVAYDTGNEIVMTPPVDKETLDRMSSVLQRTVRNEADSTEAVRLSATTLPGMVKRITPGCVCPVCVLLRDAKPLSVTMRAN